MRPGITGWAQVNGRNAISWAAKFKLDIWYVDNHTVLLDLKILMMTGWQGYIDPEFSRKGTLQWRREKSGIITLLLRTDREEFGKRDFGLL